MAIIALVVALVILAAVLGGVLGSRSDRKVGSTVHYTTLESFSSLNISLASNLTVLY
jgi:hypothetical protein